jgi:Flp pilus assembly protein TadD
MDPRLDEALALRRSGDLRRAESRVRDVLARAPRHARALHLLGCIRLQRGDAAEAVRLLKQAVAVAPTVAACHEDLAAAYLAAREEKLVEGECILALRCDGTRHRPHNLLGLAALERGDYERALGHFSDVLAAHSPDVDAMTNIAVVCNRIGDYEMAKKYSELVLRLAPEQVQAWNNLGLALRAMRRLAEARAAFERAGDFPMARFNLGYTYLLEDDLAHGLPLIEARKALLGIGRGLAKPEWDGRPHPGRTLLVAHEQGLGDTILMSRFYPALLDRFERVVALVKKPLARLIAESFPGIEVVTALEGVRYDLWCATMSLPLLLGIDSVERIPNEPWLRAPAPPTRGDRPRVGLNWAGNPSFAYDRVRSTSLERLRLLLEVRDVEWCSLHKGHLEHEAEAFGLPQPLRDATDFLDTAVVVSGLDLVVSTETAVPNLSAALGVRTCVLAGVDTDWRWRSWYPGVTICAQESAGDWGPPVVKVLEFMREELLKAA